MHFFNNRTQFYNFTQADAENIFKHIFGNHKECIFNFVFDSNEDTKGFDQMKRKFNQSDFRGKGRRINEGFSSSMRMKQEPLIVEVFCTLEQLFKGDKKKLKITRKVNGIDSHKVFEIDIKA